MLGKLQTYNLQPTTFYEKGHWLHSPGRVSRCRYRCWSLPGRSQPPAVSSVAGRHQRLVVRRRVHRVTLLQTLTVSAGGQSGSERGQRGSEGVRGGAEEGQRGSEGGSERGQRGSERGQRGVRAGSEGVRGVRAGSEGGRGGQSRVRGGQGGVREVLEVFGRC